MGAPPRNLGAAEPWGRYIESQLARLEQQQNNQNSAINRSLYSTSAHINSGSIVIAREIYVTGERYLKGQWTPYRTDPVPWPPGKNTVTILFSGETHLHMLYTDPAPFFWLNASTSLNAHKGFGHPPYSTPGGDGAGLVPYVRHYWTVVESGDRLTSNSRDLQCTVGITNLGSVDSDADPDNTISGGAIFIFN